MSFEGAILVTGGAGYVGSHVCKALAGAGYVPVTYDNLSRGHQRAVQWGPFERGELADTSRLRAVMERHRVGAVAHLAGLIAVGESVREPLAYWQANVAGSACLLDAMRQAGVARLVFSSTCAIYGEPARQPIDESFPAAPVSPYAWTKLVTERMLDDCARAHGLKYLALRYFNAAGADPDGETGEAHEPETHLIPLVLEAAAGLRDAITLYGDDYPTSDGTCVRDYVHVADIARAHLLGLDYLAKGGDSVALNLGSGSGFTVRQVIDAAEAVTGLKVPVRVGPRRDGDPAMLVGDAAKARAVLGWSPNHPRLEDQIAHAWAWLRAQRGL